MDSNFRTYHYRSQKHCNTYYYTLCLSLIFCSRLQYTLIDYNILYKVCVSGEHSQGMAQQNLLDIWAMLNPRHDASRKGWGIVLNSGGGKQVQG